MGIKVIPRSVAVLQTGGSQLFVDIDHTEDSISLGDGTNLVELQQEGAIWCLPVKPIGGGDASAANQTSGDQLTQITDSLKTDTVEIDDVGGEKALKVSVIASVGAAGGASATDESAFTAGSSLGAPAMGQYDANDSDVVADGQMGILGMTAERWLKVAVQNNISGFATSANQTTIIGHLDGVEGLLTTIDTDTGAMASSLSAVEGYLDGVEGLLTTIDTDTGGIATSTSSIDTKASTIIGHVDGIEGLLTTIDTDTGGIALSVDGIEGLLTTIDADTGGIALSVDGIEGLLTTIDADTGAMVTALQLLDNAVSGNEFQVDVITMPTTTVIGSAAHDNGSPGTPIMIAARANNANPTAVAAGDVTYLNADLAGRLITSKSDRALVTNFVGDIATTTEETMLGAGGAGVFHDITQLTLTNAHADTAIVAFIRDATAGSTVWQHSIPAQSGIVVHFDPPLCQTTANNNWTIDMTSSTSTLYYTGVAIKRLA